MPDDYGGLERFLRMGEGRRLKKLAQQAAYITSLEPDFEALSDEQLAAKTVEFKQRLENGEDLDELVFEAFATVREAAKRSVGMRPFDVQLMGAIVLHEGDIAEMKTGEGKTLVATMPLYLNALEGRGVHLVTVNDYLAKRDAEWMGPVYEKLGMRASFIRTMMPFDERMAAYEADITYGTNSEFGFHYLRDNMATALEGTVQRSHAYAIVDEVDSILIDEARTPLIISGEPETAAKTYYDFARIARQLTGVPHKFVPKGMPKDEDDADFEFDEKFKTVSPRESAIEKVEHALGIENLYAPQNAQLVNHLVQALKAESLYQRDVDYVVQDGEVKIVDEFTGRIMEGRRWSEGLHQAVEAKEGVAIQEEHVTLATITLQNYFRLYEKLGGLYVLGTERHEARRIDNQLRGRSGRQGDPGESRFYLSGQDELVRLFAGDRIYGIMERFKVPEDQPMEAGILSRQVENAQKKVEEQNFVMRKNVLKYDDVMNKQRMVIYEQRRQVLEGDDMSEQVLEWIDEVVASVVAQFTQDEYSEEWDLEALVRAMTALYETEITVEELREDLGEISRDALVEEF